MSPARRPDVSESAAVSSHRPRTLLFFSSRASTPARSKYGAQTAPPPRPGRPPPWCQCLRALTSVVRRAPAPAVPAHKKSNAPLRNETDPPNHAHLFSLSLSPLPPPHAAHDRPGPGPVPPPAAPDHHPARVSTSVRRRVVSCVGVRRAPNLPGTHTLSPPPPLPSHHALFLRPTRPYYHAHVRQGFIAFGDEADEDRLAQIEVRAAQDAAWVLKKVRESGAGAPVGFGGLSHPLATPRPPDRFSCCLTSHLSVRRHGHRPTQVLALKS